MNVNNIIVWGKTMLQQWYGTTVAISHKIYSCTVVLVRFNG